MAHFRIIDTGALDGRHQVALDQALIELHKAGQSPDTIRFVRFPPTVLVGRHQAIAREVNVAHCHANGIGLVRRIAGGGAIYLDEGQVGWELLISRQRTGLGSLREATAAICGAVAHGLSRTFGIDARFRPRTDIAVGERKLCGTSGYIDGDSLIYQGTVLVDVDPGVVYACLAAPPPAPEDYRLVTLRDLLGEAPPLSAVYQAVLLGLIEKLGIEPQPGDVSETERTLAAMMLEQDIASDSFVHEIDEPGGAGIAESVIETPGGKVSAFARTEGEGEARRVASLEVAGDFFVVPPRLVHDLEAAVRGVPVAEVAGAVDAFFAGTPPPEVLTVAPEHFRAVIVHACTGAATQ